MSLRFLSLPEMRSVFVISKEHLRQFIPLLWQEPGYRIAPYLLLGNSFREAADYTMHTPS